MVSIMTIFKFTDEDLAKGFYSTLAAMHAYPILAKGKREGIEGEDFYIYVDDISQAAARALFFRIATSFREEEIPFKGENIEVESPSEFEVSRIDMACYKQYPGYLLRTEGPHHHAFTYIMAAAEASF